jgi:LPS O-antigen subunit length determinant protein (WzzB/FepE family)
MIRIVILAAIIGGVIGFLLARSRRRGNRDD